MTDWVLYLDESGSTEAHTLPLRNGQTPVFTLSGVILPCDRWREYDREFLYLKREFFGREINGSTQLDTGWEAKGNQLLAPRNSGSDRNRVFVERVIALVERYNGKVLGVSFVKNVASPMPASSMYTKGFQILAERYDVFLREAGCKGMIIADSRMAHLKKGGGLDYTVAVSYLSFVFGHIEGRELIRIVEAPLFADSKLTAGLQIAGIISMLTYTNTYRVKLPYAEGSPEGYLNYGHTAHFYERFSRVVFTSKERYAGHTMKGLRTIDHREKTSR